ncbi:MAG TPA: carcinine hydrolase/isopenicillin-N N-acyltransferase family protein [Phycicoccus sp.]|nr:carcinine hydrolase/isopenicillin-N N-acyltransferase family protein [Phycicoccus sp.]
MCDTLVCLTSSGVLFAKNSDRDPNEAQTLRWFPGQSHDVGADLRCTFSTISQVEHTHAVVLSQPWWMWGAEMGANEHGLVIGNEAVFSRGAPRASTGSELLGMDLVRLALERARTAEEAAGVIVALLETHGQGGPCSWEHPRFTYDNSFLIADPSGALVLETAGRAWASERVAGRGRSISNGYTIGSFGRHYADRAREQVGRASSRRARTQAAVARAQSPGDLFAALREHEVAAPKYNAVSGALGAPCAHAGGAVTSTQSTASWVADLRDASTPVHWATATSAPCTSTFFPFTVDESASDLAALADEGAAPLRNVHDSAHRWWRHERLHRLVLRDPSAAMARFRPERDRIEAGWLAESGGQRPGIREALATIDEAESRWYAELLAMALPERRPSWLRALWSRLDGAAHLPEHRNGPSGVGAR